MSRSERKQLTRQRILDAAGRGFRKAGFGGIGVDGLAKEAGVTSGAFYAHFESKAAAFRESVAQGMAELKDGVRHFQGQHGRTWWPEFVSFYLGEKRKCELPESCALQSLASEISRTDPSSRAEFEAELLKVATLIVAGPTSDHAPIDIDGAMAALSILVGAVTLTRAVADPVVGEMIAVAAKQALLSGGLRSLR